MAQPRRPSGEDEEQLMLRLWDESLKNDPLKFVMAIFPWGTPALKEKGPREWQKKKLTQLRDHIAKNELNRINGKPFEVLQDATVSGRGVGKSALVAWLILWFMTTRKGGTVIVAANTEDQLKTKTWAELSRWHTLSVNKHWFELAATSLKPHTWYSSLAVDNEALNKDYYYAQASLWTEEDPGKFVGAHNPLGMMFIFDEAAGIPKSIWDVVPGCFTEVSPNRFWYVFGNGRKNTGAFFECFNKNRERWVTTQIDARTVEGSDHTIYDKIIAEEGPDSDKARIEVYGQFPGQEDGQFIPKTLVDEALVRELDISAHTDNYAPLIMGVDPARYGNDSTVIRFRQGRNARILPPVVMTGANNVEVANKVSELILKYNPDAVNIDSGSGGGVIDLLRSWKFKINEILFGGKPDDIRYADKRTEMWGKVKEWLPTGCIDKHERLVIDLLGPRYEFRMQSDRIALEPKDSMRKRGLASPDHGDALALTFAVNVPSSSLKVSRKGQVNPMAKGLDYDIFSHWD